MITHTSMQKKLCNCGKSTKKENKKSTRSHISCVGHRYTVKKLSRQTQSYRMCLSSIAKLYLTLYINIIRYTNCNVNNIVGQKRTKNKYFLILGLTTSVTTNTILAYISSSTTNPFYYTYLQSTSC